MGVAKQQHELPAFMQVCVIAMCSVRPAGTGHSHSSTHMQPVEINTEGCTTKVGPDLLMLSAHAHAWVQLVLLHSTAQHSTARSARSAHQVTLTPESCMAKECVQIPTAAPTCQQA
jgi:hypothetical protein